MRSIPADCCLIVIIVSLAGLGCGHSASKLASAEKAQAEAEAAAARHTQLLEPADQQPSATVPRQSLRTHEDLDATAWMQTSAEYECISRQTYRAATEALQKALADKLWSAIPQQSLQLAQGNGQELPPAVIVDVDETVLDNTGYQVELIVGDSEYTLESWLAWVEKCDSAPYLGPGNSWLPAVRRMWLCFL